MGGGGEGGGGDGSGGVGGGGGGESVALRSGMHFGIPGLLPVDSSRGAKVVRVPGEMVADAQFVAPAHHMALLFALFAVNVASIARL